MEIQHILLQIQFCANAVVSQSYFFAVAKSSEALQSDSLTQSNNLEAIFSKLMHVMQSIEFQNQIANTEISNPIQWMKTQNIDLQKLLAILWNKLHTTLSSLNPITLQNTKFSEAYYSVVVYEFGGYTFFCNDPTTIVAFGAVLLLNCKALLLQCFPKSFCLLLKFLLRKYT